MISAAEWVRQQVDKYGLVETYNKIYLHYTPCTERWWLDGADAELARYWDRALNEAEGPGGFALATSRVIYGE